MTPSECAERLGVDVSLMREWIKIGELKADDLAEPGAPIRAGTFRRLPFVSPRRDRGAAEIPEGDEAKRRKKA